MVEAISKMPTPDVTREDPKKQVKSFLGMASYIRKFIKGYAKIAKPLTELTESGRKFEWTNECDQAWKEVVKLIAEKKGLWAVNYDQSVYVRTDECCERLGAYLFQIVERKRRTLKGKKS